MLCSHPSCCLRESLRVVVMCVRSAADELHIQHYMRRHFDWHENALFLEDIPAALLEPERANYLHYSYYPVVKASTSSEGGPRGSSLSSGINGSAENSRCRVCVVLGEADSFIDAPSVIKYLRQGPAGSAAAASGDDRSVLLLPDLITVEGADHGGWANGSHVDDVIEWVLSLPELRQVTQTVGRSREDNADGDSSDDSD